jgi:hypothetical protein
MLRWSIGANSCGAGNIPVFDASDYSMCDFPVTLYRAAPGPALSPPRISMYEYVHFFRRMFRFIHHPSARAVVFKT